MSITTKDIARIAGVSQATVSRCLNDSNLVSEKTKEHVKQIAMEQGFEFNANARSLSTQKTGTIGVIYPDNFDDFSNSLYLNSLHNQLRDRLEQKDLNLILSFAQNKYSGESNITKLIAQKKVDGLIIVSDNLDQETFRFLDKTSIPSVFMHRYADSPYLDGFDIVGTDNEHGGYLAAQHLMQQGHKKILCVSSTETGKEFQHRTKGFITALLTGGIELSEPVFFGDMTFQSGYRIAEENINIIKKVTSIFVQNDIMALGVIESLKNNGVRIPEDISIIGYDDIELTTFFRPYLTTIHQPREEVATLTCEILLELIKSKRKTEKRKIILKPKLVIRDSCVSL